MRSVNRRGLVDHVLEPATRGIWSCAARGPRSGARALLALCLALLLPVGLIGCSSPDPAPSRYAYPEPPSPTEALAGAPSWVTRGCRSHWTDDEERRTVVCGVGSAGPNKNRVAARETAVARARSAVARSVQVTIESLVRLEDSGETDDGELRSIVHQLTSASLPGCQVESVWRSSSGEVHALVSLEVARVQQSMRKARSLPAPAREDLARRAADAFAALDAQMDAAYPGGAADSGQGAEPNGGVSVTADGD